MKELKKEAEKYAKNTEQVIAHGLYSTKGDRKLGFIAGATSTYVEQEKIKFAISVLNLQKVNTNKDGLMYIEADKVLNVIKELEQKLLEI
jgi:hypothetical protein